MDLTIKESESESSERIEEEKLNKEVSMSSLDTTISNEGGYRLLTDTNSPKKLKIDDYDIIKTIGKGSFGKVVLAKNLKNSKNYAIKIIDKHFIELQDKVDQIHVEKHILSKLSHPNIIKLYKTFHNSKKLYYVFEYGDKGDLKEYLNINGIPHYSLAKFLIAEIVLALEHLHSNEIIHRDLKPENIVLNEKLHIKIVRIRLKQIDFATAVYFGKYFDLREKIFKNQDQNKSDNKTLLGTAEYISPEMINENQCSYEGDLWALGCIVYQLFHNDVPFSGTNNLMILKNIIENRMNPINKNLPSDVKDLILSLLIQDPHKRLGANRNFKALKEHNFFSEISFDLLPTMDPPLKQIQRRNTSALSTNTDFIFAFQTADEDEEEEEVYCKTDYGSKSSHLFFLSVNFQNKASNSILYQGIVKKKSPWLHYNKRKLILYPDRLEYIDPISNRKKGEIILNILSKGIWKDNYTFEVFTPKRTYVFKTESEGIVSVWCCRINLVIEYLKKD